MEKIIKHYPMTDRLIVRRGYVLLSGMYLYKLGILRISEFVIFLLYSF